MPFILKHRSMKPPVYVGQDRLVTTKDEAMAFATFDQAQAAVTSLGDLGKLYEPVVKLEILK